MPRAYKETPMKKRVLVAMSGGVDSSVAAVLLKEQGYEVSGATIQTWASKDCDKLNTRACCSIEGVDDARSVANRLDIPYYVFNMEKEFKEAVVDYFSAEYMQGRTPNPCIACNEHIKFRLFRKRALAMGVDMIATGHYAQISKNEETGFYYVHEGLDAWKDQSYVLFPLKQRELAHTLLPLGKLHKDRVREIAEENKLRVFDKPDSQEICFIPSNDYATFLKKEKNVEEKTGSICSKEGKEIGKHAGFFNFTIGQRRGLGIATGEPLYVTGIDSEKNEVVVGTKADVSQQKFTVKDMNWMMPVKAGERFSFDVKIRSKHKQAAAVVEIVDEGLCEVTFEAAQDAITPGQGAVMYDGPKVTGGGWIDQVAR